MTARFALNPRGAQPSQKLRAFVAEQANLNDHILFQSSGSTGQPKWIALSHSALEASARAVNMHLEVNAQDIFALPLPEFHVGGFGVVERARVAHAECVRWSSAWNPSAFASWLKETRASITSLVPAQIYDLQMLGLRAPRTLRAIVVGGGALPHALYHAARQLGWPLLPSYGLTECASQVATAPLASLSTSDFPRAQTLPHIWAQQIAEQKVSIESAALLSGYVREVEEKIEWVDPKLQGAFVLPDRVTLSGNFLSVEGRWEQEFKILGEWIRWEYLRKKFAELAFQEKQFLKFEIEIFSDERRGNKIALLCEEFDYFAQALVAAFNAEVFPFERITHYYEGNLPRSELGKVQRLKINPICLKEISG